MTTVSYDFTGTNGTLPAGASDVSGASSDASIQSNQLRLQAAAGEAATCLLNTIDFDTSAEQWITGTVYIDSGVPWLQVIFVVNGAVTEFCALTFKPSENQIGVLDETNANLVTAASRTVDAGDVWKFKLHVIYGASGEVEVWAWRDGVDTPLDWSDTPTVSGTGVNLTVSGGHSGVSAIHSFNGGGATTEHRVDDIVITDVDPATGADYGDGRILSPSGKVLFRSNTIFAAILRPSA